jgi:hypothetical protein
MKSIDYSKLTYEQKLEKLSILFKQYILLKIEMEAKTKELGKENKQTS